MTAPLSLALPPELVEAIAEQLAPRIAAELAGHAVGARHAPPLDGEEWRLWTVDDVANRLNRSERWVREHKEAIGYIRLDGGALAFDPDDVKAFARARRVPLADDADLEPRSRLRAVEL